MAKANLAPATGDCNPTEPAERLIFDGPESAPENLHRAVPGYSNGDLKMADGSTLDMVRSLASDGFDERDQLLLRQWRIWHTAELAANRLLLQEGCEEEVDRLDDVGSAAFQEIDKAGGSSPIAIAARLHMHLHHAGGNKFIQDLPHCLVVNVLRDLLPSLPDEMSAALKPIIAAASPSGAVRIRDAIGTPNSLALDDGLPESGHRRSLILEGGVQYARFHQSAEERDENWPWNPYEVSSLQAMESIVLTTRATTKAEAAVQAYMLLAGLETLDVIEDEDTRKSRRCLEMAAQSVHALLAKEAAAALPLEFQINGRCGALTHKFWDGK